MSFKRVIPAVVAASLLASTAAFAAQNLNGEIKSIDTKAATITLKSGQVFLLPKSFDMKSVKAGQNVMVTYDSKDGKMVATQVKPL